jgi:hypothetical protein
VSAVREAEKPAVGLHPVHAVRGELAAGDTIPGGGRSELGSENREVQANAKARGLQPAHANMGTKTVSSVAETAAGADSGA